LRADRHAGGDSSSSCAAGNSGSQKSGSMQRALRKCCAYRRRWHWSIYPWPGTISLAVKGYFPAAVGILRSRPVMVRRVLESGHGGVVKCNSYEDLSVALGDDTMTFRRFRRRLCSRQSGLLQHLRIILVVRALSCSLSMLTPRNLQEDSVERGMRSWSSAAANKGQPS